MSIYRLSGEIELQQLKRRMRLGRAGSPQERPAGEPGLKTPAQPAESPGAHPSEPAGHKRPPYAAHAEALCREYAIPAPTFEHAFHPTRRWRFDMAWLGQKAAIELDGGIWIGGRHTSGAGFADDMDKLNAAVLLGWRVLRFEPLYLANAIASMRILLCDSQP